MVGAFSKKHETPCRSKTDRTFPFLSGKGLILSFSTKDYVSPKMAVVLFEKGDIVCSQFSSGWNVDGSHGDDVEEGGDLPPWGEND